MRARAIPLLALILLTASGCGPRSIIATVPVRDVRFGKIAASLSCIQSPENDFCDWGPAGGASIYIFPAGAEGYLQGEGLSQRWGCPRWSPDGAKLAFVTYSTMSPPSELGELYIVDDSGTHNLALVYSCPAWSPDGQQLAVAGAASLYTIDIATQQWTALVPLPRDNWNSFTPDWSPDGRKIAYTTYEAIYEVNIGEAEPTRLTGPCDCTFGNPRYSPDGQWLLFPVRHYVGEKDHRKTEDNICLMSQDSPQVTCWIGGLYADWSPDGSQVAFLASDSGSIHVANIDGSEDRIMLRSPGWTYNSFDWGP